MDNKKKVIILVCVLLGLGLIGSFGDDKEEPKEYKTTAAKVEEKKETKKEEPKEVKEEPKEEEGTYKLQHGELLDAKDDNNMLIIKAKIGSSYNNRATINQNGFNVEDIILKQGGDKFDEIQYWAVADMSNGEENKVISFTLSKDLINSIKDKKIVGNQIVDKANDVWILPSLKN